MRKVISHRPAPIPAVIMKKFILILCSVLIVSFCYCEYWNADDIDLLISFDKIFIKSGDSIEVYIKLTNISKQTFHFEPLAPEYPAFQLEFHSEYNKNVKWDYYEKLYSSGLLFSGIIGGGSIECLPNKFIDISYNIVKFYNIEEIEGPAVFYVNGRYNINIDNYENGINYPKIIDYKKSNIVRLYFNLEQDLVSSSIRVEPHKWNVNWEDMEGDGVFTVWIDSVGGFSVEDIKQDTILFNGTLPPEEIKILPKSGNDKTKIIQLKFKKKDGILYLGELKSGETKTINISGQLNDEKWFIGETQVELVGNK